MIETPMAPPAKIKKHRWIKRSGLGGAWNLHHRLGCLVPVVTILLSVVAIFLFAIFDLTWWWIFLIPVAVLFVSFRVSRWILYNSIVCPNCGYNPTRRKADGERRKDNAKVLTQLERYEACPECGFCGEDEGS